MNECVLSDRHRVPLLYILVVYEYSIDDVTIGHRPKDANPPWLRACVPTRLFSPRLFSSTVNLGAYPVSHVRGGRSSTVNPADGDLYNNGAIPCLIFKSGSPCYNIDVVATLFLNNFYPCYPIP